MSIGSATAALTRSPIWRSTLTLRSPWRVGRICVGRGGRVIADVREYGWEKVRGPKGSALGDTHAGRHGGKQHRNDTARGRLYPHRRARGRGEMVVESAPTARVAGG